MAEPAPAPSPTPTETAEEVVPADEPFTPLGCGKGGYAVDHGAREFANGRVVTDAEGRPVEYIVASGDAPVAVAELLCYPNRTPDFYFQVGQRLELPPTMPTE